MKKYAYIQLLSEDIPYENIDICRFCTYEMNSDFHESALLKLNCDLANELLKWFPKLDFESTTKMTALWYKNYYDSETSNIKEFTSKQINDYMNLNSGKN